MNAVDTNVLIYAHDPRDPVKKMKAVALLDAFGDDGQGRIFMDNG